MDKSIFKKFFDFAVLCVYILSVIGGTAYLFYYGQPLFGVVALMVAAMAFPFVRDHARDLLEG